MNRLGLALRLARRHAHGHGIGHHDHRRFVKPHDLARPPGTVRLSGRNAVADPPVRAAAGQPDRAPPHFGNPPVARTTPLLQRLRDTSTETVILGKRQGDAVIYLQVFEGLNAIRYSARPGEFKPLHSSAMGKASLGSLPAAELRATLQTLERPAVTAATIVDAEALAADIAASRRRGYSLTRGENVTDVWALATPITLGAETLGVTVAGPRHRIEPTAAESARLLMATCHVLERSLKGEAEGQRRRRRAGVGSKRGRG